MKRICAWCRKDMGEKEPLEDTSTTHGMCEECFKKYNTSCRGNRSLQSKSICGKTVDEVAPVGLFNESCEACGSFEFAPSSFREHNLCGSCIVRWNKLDSIMQNAEGRNATWGEMLQGLHPIVVLGKE